MIRKHNDCLADRIVSRQPIPDDGSGQRRDRLSTPLRLLLQMLDDVLFQPNRDLIEYHFPPQLEVVDMANTIAARQLPNVTGRMSLNTAPDA
ncbi:MULTISPECIES: hypothetical protein [unclassified Janthinobacterium]|uniref:hypothetical protein n=1 Tax=unclassified Janthinobacterium TaxID=2610881 RepID=UPI00161FD3BE|nr:MULTISPECIES: hypothetical protein [unclassified Janthinobacterium]MBB5371690.1 hypothetical protein [Janthinobacterium sp. K2C7]MBB5384495.1 hypothetical protein [Janthinobacterium sp. K2Li3]MBB5389771.1 hypothetical protein [Janthinobacterium sp. K2E3]